jgi:hypothetical protein
MRQRTKNDRKPWEVSSTEMLGTVYGTVPENTKDLEKLVEERIQSVQTPEQRETTNDNH